METSTLPDSNSILKPAQMRATSNELFPVFLKANDLSVLLIGGSTIALEKLQAVLGNSPSAQVTVVADWFSDEFIAFTEDKSTVELIEDRFSEIYLGGQQLVISAVNSETISAEIREKANERGILYNAADKPELCDFYLGSVVTKGNLKIGISTNGKSPTIAKRLKEIFNENIPNEIDHSLENLSKIRIHLKGDFQQKVV